jgi:group II intron reverse transcriptase/maturase
MWFERWFLSSNAKDIGVCATWGLVFALSVIWYTDSSITGEYYHVNISYLSYGTALIISNKFINGVAGAERYFGILLPTSNKVIKELWQDYVKKLETLRQVWVILLVLSRISRQGFSNLKASDKYTGVCSNLEAECHSSEESNMNDITEVQESKSKKTKWMQIYKNGETRKPLDLSASSTNKRRRSSHSSHYPGDPAPDKKTKGNSVNTKAEKQGSRSKVNSQNLRMFVQSKLNLYRNADGKYNGIVRILADAGFLQYCYMLIKGKPGNMSKGTTKETLDGISYKWFEDTALSILRGGLKFTPARRVMIPKPGKKELRPLGVGAPREKIIQKGIQVILETIYEPEFLDCSHGFRPGRSTHSALRPLYLKGHHHKWVIQGDISKCFDKIPHQVIMNILRKRFVCDRLLFIINQALKVGYIDSKTKKVHVSPIGTPQGSVLSPLLANIVLHELDKYLVETIIPENNKGKGRRTNAKYNAIAYARDPKNPNSSPKERLEALKLMRMTPRMDTRDPNFRRSMYIRYADDFVYLFAGPKSEALIIRDKIKEFLIEHTGLELNVEKTLVTHLEEGFNFLGAHISTSKIVDYRMKTRTVNGTPITMRANVRARVNMPTKLLLEKLIKAGFARRNPFKKILAKPLTKVVNLDHATIVQFFNSKIHGLLNYYTFAGNRIETQNLIWILRHSLAKTLARKFKLSSSRQAFKKFGPNLKDPTTDVEVFVPKTLPTIHKYNVNELSTEPTKLMEQTWFGRLTQTNLFKTCVLCNTSSNIQMHHLRKAKDVRTKMRDGTSSFKSWIGATQRKQIPLCQYHHTLYHNGKLLNFELNQISKYTHNMSKDIP